MENQPEPPQESPPTSTNTAPAEHSASQPTNRGGGSNPDLPNPPKSTKTLNILIVILGVLCVAAAGVYYFGYRDTSPEPPAPEPPVTPEPVEVDAENLFEANNFFNFQLLKSIISEDLEDNLFISPLSMEMALLMTYTGADNETAEEMADALGVSNLSMQTVYNESMSLLSLLNRTGNEVTISVANSLWGSEDETFIEAFIDNSKKYFDAEVRNVSFSNPQTVDIINGWVEDKTNDKIKDLLSPSSIDELTVLVLVNAIYFNGTWADEFDPDSTEDADFTLASGQDKTVDMMFQEGDDYQYYEDDSVQLLELPYTDESTVMRILLPKEGESIETMVQGLSSEKWSEYTSQLVSKEGLVYLPKFKFEYGTKQMIPYLQSMGMDKAFSGCDADFSGMSEDALEYCWYISLVLHKSYIDVNEEGTEAAAATAVGIELGAMEEEPDIFVFRANRPFFFTIEDKDTGVIMFSGVVIDPEYN